MLKHKRSSERDVSAQGENQKRKGFQSGESLSDLIGAATVLLRTQLEDYSTIRSRLIVKFDEMFVVSPDTRIRDLREMIHLHIQASHAVIKIVRALESLAQLSQFVGSEAQKAESPARAAVDRLSTDFAKRSQQVACYQRAKVRQKEPQDKP
jgi:hypothetical protein